MSNFDDALNGNRYKALKKASKNIQQLRDIALSITEERKISVIYNEQAPTACIDLKTLMIQLSPNIIPKTIHKYPRMFQRCLDAQVSHEAGHFKVTRPLESRYERFENSKKYKKLSHLIVNIVEDKRVNYFIEKRYRFDLGKRLSWFRHITCKSMNTSMDEIIQRQHPFEIERASKPAIMVNLLIHVGLYDGEINAKLWEQLNHSQQKDVKTALRLMKKSQFTWIKHDLIEIVDDIYRLIEKHIQHSDINKLMKFVPVSIEGGQMGLDLSEEDENEVKTEEEAEEEAEKAKEDLNEGGFGAGISKGEHIPAPDANHNQYYEYVIRNQPQIDRLLNKLKVFVKPIMQKRIFQNSGRLMKPLIAKAFINSLRRPVTQIYQKSILTFEKQKVALGFCIDFSGSMSWSVACDTVTQMNEVFGNWLDDESYAIIVFGADYQKIKTFFESFDNTRARIGGISVDTGGTMVSNPLSDIHKMFNLCDSEKQKILVLCSDFWFGDSDEAEDEIKRMIDSGIAVMFIGLCSGDDKIFEICPNEKNVFRTYCEDMKDLPEHFLEIYMKSIGNIRK